MIIPPLTILLLILFSTIQCAPESFRILIYSPRMIPSHVAFVADIANLLANQGHRVTVIDNKLRSDIGNRLDTSSTKVIEVETSETVKKLLATGGMAQKFWRMNNTPDEQKEVMEQLGAVFLEQCKHLVLGTSVLSELETMEFDFAMHEVFDVCGIGIFERLNIRRSVILSSTGMRDIVSEALGIAGPLDESSILSDYGATVPLPGVRRNLRFHSAWRNFFQVQSIQLEGIFQVDQDFEDLLRYSNLLFVNTHELADSSRRWARRVFEIGGISFKEPKPLEEEYTKILNDFSKTVLISFGTTTLSFLMPDDYKEAILKAMSKFPMVQFIWKYEIEDDFVKRCTLGNVIFKKYVPQTDLLESGKISLFISHGGQNSLLEAFRSKTRLLIISLFGDQHRNARIALENSLANVLRKEDLSNVNLIESAIRQALESNEKLERNLHRISSNLRDAKKRSEQRFLAAIEDVLSVPEPPNFRFSEKFYTSDALLTMLDGLLIAVFTILLSLAFLKSLRSVI